MISYLGLVRRDFYIDRREHAALFATRDAQRNTHVSPKPHPGSLERRVQSHVDGLTALARVVLVYDRRVVGDLVASCPPAWMVEVRNLDFF